MKSNEKETQRDLTTATRASEDVRGPARRMLDRIGRRGALVLGIVAVTSAGFAVLYGCSSHSDEQATTAASSPTDVAQPAAFTPPSSPAHSTTTEENSSPVSAESVPPEIEASVADTLVVPGDVIEISAVTSPDVIEVSLRDRVGRIQSFSPDSSTGSWRTYYRVPMKMPGERLGLSVTAKNGVERWRRVWIFLHPTEPGDPNAQPEVVEE